MTRLGLALSDAQLLKVHVRACVNYERSRAGIRRVWQESRQTIIDFARVARRGTFLGLEVDELLGLKLLRAARPSRTSDVAEKSGFALTGDVEVDIDLLAELVARVYRTQLAVVPAPSASEGVYLEWARSRRRRPQV